MESSERTRNGSFSPWNFKQILSKFAPQFEGYAQHDSQELINFVLDGIHEDLNLVKDRPYVERQESDGRADEIIAVESW